MTTDNKISPKARFGNASRRKGKINLVAYNVRIDPVTVELIKQYQELHSIDSQGEVITKAILLISQEAA